MSLRQANDFVEQHHRHHKKRQGHKFSIGLEKDGEVIGCVIVGRVSARKLDSGREAEIYRVCVKENNKNACSFLISAACRACKAMGYDCVYTYTLDSEPGTSLIASGWECLGKTPGRSWSVPSRKRKDSHPLGVKKRWVRRFT